MYVFAISDESQFRQHTYNLLCLSFRRLQILVCFELSSIIIARADNQSVNTKAKAESKFDSLSL